MPIETRRKNIPHTPVRCYAVFPLSEDRRSDPYTKYYPSPHEDTALQRSELCASSLLYDNCTLRQRPAVRSSLATMPRVHLNFSAYPTYPVLSQDPWATRNGRFTHQGQFNLSTGPAGIHPEPSSGSRKSLKSSNSITFPSTAARPGPDDTTNTLRYGAMHHLSTIHASTIWDSHVPSGLRAAAHCAPVASQRCLPGDLTYRLQCLPSCFFQPSSTLPNCLGPKISPEMVLATSKHKRTRRGRRGGKNRRRYQLASSTVPSDSPPRFADHMRTPSSVTTSNTVPVLPILRDVSTDNMDLPSLMGHTLSDEIGAPGVLENEGDTHMNSAVVASVLHNILGTPRETRSGNEAGTIPSSNDNEALGKQYYNNRSTKPELFRYPASFWTPEARGSTDSSISSNVGESGLDTLLPRYSGAASMQDTVTPYGTNEFCIAEKQLLSCERSVTPPARLIFSDDGHSGHPDVTHSTVVMNKLPETYSSWVASPSRKTCLQHLPPLFNEANELYLRELGGADKKRSCPDRLSSCSTQSTNYTDIGSAGPTLLPSACSSSPSVPMPLHPFEKNVEFTPRVPPTVFPSPSCRVEKRSGGAACTASTPNDWNTAALLIEALSRNWDAPFFHAH